MRIMGLVKADAESEAGTPPTAELLARVGALMEEVQKAEVLRATDGLLPSATGKRVRLADGKLSVIDGPFGDPQNLVAAYAVYEVPSMEEASEWTKRFLDAVGGGECELRPIFEASDFGAAQ